MDKTWQKNLMYLLGMLAALGTAYATFVPGGSREIVSIPSGLEEKIDSVAADVKLMKAENAVRRDARDKEMASINENVNQKFLILMDGIKVLQNQVFELGRSRKSARARVNDEEDGT